MNFAEFLVDDIITHFPDFIGTIGRVLYSVGEYLGVICWFYLACVGVPLGVILILIGKMEGLAIAHIIGSGLSWFGVYLYVVYIEYNKITKQHQHEMDLINMQYLSNEDSVSTQTPEYHDSV